MGISRFYGFLSAVVLARAGGRHAKRRVVRYGVPAPVKPAPYPGLPSVQHAGAMVLDLSLLPVVRRCEFGRF